MALFQKDTNPIPNKPAARNTTPSLLGIPASEHAQAFQAAAADAGRKASGDEHKASESRLIVGPNIKLKGVEIEDCDTLVVEGYVEASMDSRVIEISESGVYKGTVEIDTAIIRGHFEGELTARDRLIVHATGDIRGKIRYGRLAIDEGGTVHGDLDEISAGKSKSAPSSNRADSNERDADDKGTSPPSPQAA
ncbi:MAG: polymer-forming cytoskeletal protein [Rhodospirillales bacterium]